MNRRDFLTFTSTALLTGAAIQILGCGTPIHYSDGRGSGQASDKPGVITFPDTENHGVPYQHIAILTQAEITSNESLVMSIQGNAGHDHTITLSAEDFANISKGLRVVKTTTDNGHYHTVTFS